jgi:hypothetical protein
MARKTLLNESEIRRFMKLASMGPVGQKRMDEFGTGDYAGARDEEVDVEAAVDVGTPEGDVAVEDEVVVDEPMPEDPLGDEGEAPGEGMMVSVDEFMEAFETALEEVTGEEVSTEVDLGADEEAALEGGDELEAGMPEAEPVPDVDVGVVEDDVAMGMQEQIINKVASRVAARLVKENRKAQMTDELTERIFNRLTQK